MINNIIHLVSFFLISPKYYPLISHTITLHTATTIDKLDGRTALRAMHTKSLSLYQAGFTTTVNTIIMFGIKKLTIRRFEDKLLTNLAGGCVKQR